VLLTPAYRSGAVVRFPITRATAATMRLVQESGEPVPAGARVHTPGGDTAVALDGLIFLTDAAGYNEASASWPGNRCRFSYQRPEGGDPMPDLGKVRCRAVEP
jgi:outer membrane usher protein